MCIRDSDGRLALDSWHPESSLEEVRERTGFAFDASTEETTAYPTSSEIEALRSLDPHGHFERDAAVSMRIAAQAAP